MECVWLELKPHALRPSLFVCRYLYRNPAVTFELYDSFVQMLDDVYNVKNRADVLILGDFINQLLIRTYTVCLWYCRAYLCS